MRVRVCVEREREGERETKMWRHRLTDVEHLVTACIDTGRWRAASKSLSIENKKSVGLVKIMLVHHLLEIVRRVYISNRVHALSQLGISEVLLSPTSPSPLQNIYLYI